MMQLLIKLVVYLFVFMLIVAMVSLPLLFFGWLAGKIQDVFDKSQ